MSVIQILDDADAAFRILGAGLRTVLSVTTMFADKPHRLNGRTSAQRFCVLTILPPVTALAVGLPAQRAIAQRFRALCRFSDAGMTRLSTRCGGRRPKSAKARSRGKYGTRQCSECYGDRMLVAISMVDAAPARGDVHVRMQVSPGECNGHLGGHTEFINGRLVN